MCMDFAHPQAVPWMRRCHLHFNFWHFIFDGCIQSCWNFHLFVDRLIVWTNFARETLPSHKSRKMMRSIEISTNSRDAKKCFSHETTDVLPYKMVFMNFLSYYQIMFWWIQNNFSYPNNDEINFNYPKMFEEGDYETKDDQIFQHFEQKEGKIKKNETLPIYPY